MVAGTSSNVFINEIHYDNNGVSGTADENEQIEIANTTNIDLTGWSVVLYNGSNGAAYDTIALSGTAQFKTLTFPANGIQNGGPDGIALVNGSGVVVQFLSYEGTMTATDGPAIGLTSTDIGVEEGTGSSGGVTEGNESLQLQGTGTTYGDFTWAENIVQTSDAVNTGQTIGAPPPSPGVFSIADADVAEGDAGAPLIDFTITRDGGSNGAVSVVVAAVVNGTADPSDFTPGARLVEFADGQTSATFPVRIFGDTFVEANETFEITLSSPNGGATIADGSATITILNDDATPGPGEFSVNDVSVNEGDAGTTDFTFTVTRANGSSGTVLVDYATALIPNQADASDFTPTSGTLEFLDGETSKTFTVAVNGDTDFEPTELFSVVLSNPNGGATIADGAGTGTILADDAPPATSDIVINEIHADPAADIPGDANGDGTRDFSDDEFVELVNTGSSAVDLSGFTLSDGVAVRHTFAAGTTLAAGEAIVVFGGGTPTGAFGGATVVAASSGNLGLNNSGDTVTLADGGGTTLAEVTYGGEAGDNQSITRDPDLTGNFVQHSSAPDAGGALFSPGTQIDGAAFGVAAPPVTVVLDEGFETDGSIDTGEGVRYSFSSGQGNDGFFDFFTRTDGSDIDASYQVSGQGGDFFFAAQDTDSVDGLSTDDEQSIFFTGIDITGLDNLLFSVDLAEDDSSDGNEDWDSTDFFQVFATIDGGTPFQVFGVSGLIPAGNQAPAVDTNFDGFGNGAEITPDFATFAAAIKGTGSTLDLELRFHLDSGDEDLAIDNVRVTDGAASLPPPNFSISDGGTFETGGAAFFEITLSEAAPAGGVSVDVTTSDGTATAGEDYLAYSQTIFFAEGETRSTTQTLVTVVVSDDKVFEGDETFTVTLSNPTGGYIIGDGVATGTIFDDETPLPSGPEGGPAEVFINEIHYDNSSTDVGEAVEIAGPAGTDLNGWSLILYNGNGGVVYDTINLSGTIPDQDDGFGTLSFSTPGIQNGPDAIAFVNSNGAVVQFLSYEGPFEASDGPAAGLTSEDIGVSEGSVPIGTSLQLGGNGFVYEDFTWQTSQIDTFAAVNTGQDFRAPSENGVFYVSDASAVEGDSGTTDITFNIFRVGGTTGEVSVDTTFGFGPGDIGDADPNDFTGPNGGIVTFADGETAQSITLTIQGDTESEPDETFFFNLFLPTGGATIGDGSAIGTIENDDPINLLIGEIQGAGHTSPWLGNEVSTSGIVTAVASNGFYLQDSGDGDADTSDGIFVFTGTSVLVLPGDAIDITGTVAEFRGGGDPANLTTTQLTNAGFTITSDSNPLPNAVVIGPNGITPPTETIDDDNFATYDPANDGIDFYESLEGMLVTVENPVAVDSTNGFGEIYTVASDGAGNLTATNVSAEGLVVIEGGAGGLGEFDAGAGSDFNPERIQIEDARLNGFDVNSPDVTPGAVLNTVTGVIDYAFENYELRPTAPVTVAQASTNTPEMSTLVTGAQEELSVATYNVLNFDINETDGDTDVADGRLTDIATDIGVNLGAPDIVVLQEVQDDSGSANDGTTTAVATLQALADEIFTQTGVQYSVLDNPFVVDGDTGGQPGGNIRVAMLYNPDRVTLDNASVFTVTDDNTGQLDAAFDGGRAPLGANFTFNGQTVTVIGNHFRSKIGSDSSFSAIQPPSNAGALTRAAQAAAVNNTVDNLLANDPDANVIVVGDFNEFQFEEPMEVLTGDLDFDGANVSSGTNPILSNLTDKLAPNDAFTVLFQGNAQALDHILATSNIATTAQIDAVHTNTPTGNRASDHDPLVATFTLGAPPTMIDGTNGSDVLNGTPIDDIINGLGGSDTLNGSVGNDTLNGGNGNDLLSGDEDDDTLDGGGGRDTLDGGTGLDSLTGGAGADTFIIDAEGEAGDEDTILDFTTADNIDVVGTLDRDITVVQVGNDVQIAADGLLIGTVLNANLEGVLDNITFDGELQPLLTGVINITGTTGDDNIDGTSGADAIYALNRNDVVDGMDGDDDIFGGFGNDLIDGGEGFDYLEGEGGRDTINGGDDDDTVLGGANNDTLNGDAGDDFVEGGTGNDTVTGGSGADTFSIDTDLVGQSTDTITDFTVADGDTIALTNTDGKTIAFAQDGGDVQITVDGTVMGVVESAAVADVQGATTFDGLGAPPTGEVNEIRGTNQSETIDGTNGIDLIFGFGGADIITGLDGADQIFGGFGADGIMGGEGDDIINGEGGSDKLSGGDDNDTINGGNGNDALSGGDGDDTLNGDAGSDFLDGGAGANILTGGAGSDTFFLDASDIFTDTVTDFSQADFDKIEFTNAGQSDIIFVFDGEDVSVLSNGATVAVFENTTLADVVGATTFDVAPASITEVDNSFEEDGPIGESGANPLMGMVEFDAVL
ncbi:MAG: Calx-beta domain-containing protein [Pseudomonadota bacterium]